MNVVITQNTAGTMGGGLAACHTGRNFVYATDGGAIFDNTANGVALETYFKVNNDVDGGDIWKSWTPAQRKLFMRAANDIFTAGVNGYGDSYNRDYNAGALFGNVMLGYGKQMDDLENMTTEQMQDVAKHLSNYTGYRVSVAEPDKLNEVDAGNNGTIYSDRFLVLTAHPSEEGKRAAMENGNVFITDNEAVYNDGGRDRQQRDFDHWQGNPGDQHDAGYLSRQNVAEYRRPAKRVERRRLLFRAERWPGRR